ncbi:hypothetical protein NMG60_11009178 [Bertholletia excelsa]
MEDDQQLRKWKTRKPCEDEEDRLSQLPCNVLSSIFSHLTAREAVRTSVVSTKWRYLWTRCLSHITLDVDNMLDQEEFSNPDSLREVEFQKLIVPWKRMLAFLSAADQFVRGLSPDHKIERFKVYFSFYRNKYGGYLDRWISFAISRGVEELELDLLEVDHYLAVPVRGRIYDFPCDHLINDGNIRQTNLLGFNTLKILYLRWVDLRSNDHVSNLLSSCPMLEWLSLHECAGLHCLRIVHPSCARLQYLNVCQCVGLNAIEVRGINIEKFEYKGCRIDFVFNEVTQLKTVFSHLVQWRMDACDVLTIPSLLNSLPHVETWLLFCSFCKKAELLPHEFPTFSKLKTLSIVEIATSQRDLSRLATFLKAFPSLERLELHHLFYDDLPRGWVQTSFLSPFYEIKQLCLCYLSQLHTLHSLEEEGEMKRVAGCPHERLREVLITGAIGHVHEIEIAVCLLKNAVLLEKMTIDPRPRYYTGEGEWDVAQARGSWMTHGRKKVVECIRSEARPRTTLTIL